MRRKEEKILIAGAGGQGIIFLGKVIAQAALREGKWVSYIRSYGAEMRGGTAYCMVRIGTRAVASPVFEKPTAAIIMNAPSFERFQKRFSAGIQVFFNGSSGVRRGNIRCTLYEYPFDSMALNIGEARAANVVALGALLSRYAVVQKKTVEMVFNQYFGARSPLARINKKALEAGWSRAR